MALLNLTRRAFVRTSLLITALGLSGCLNRSKKFVIRSTEESLPDQWLQKLPPSWRFDNLKIKPKRYPYSLPFEDQTDLFAIEDGWIADLQVNELLPLELDDLLPDLSHQARFFLRSLSPGLRDKLFPIAVTPWVMLFRNGEPWFDKAKMSWEVLLEPNLQGQVVLPNSSRVVISLSDRMGTSDELKRLRQQAISFDDRYALNWIASGKARVAVLPLQRCIPSLVRDHRLNVISPVEGSPLNWTLLARPLSSQASLPNEWFERTWQLPSLSKLLSQGMIPPIDYFELTKGVSSLPNQFKSFLLPSKKTWDNCWSLPPLDLVEKEDLENRWINSIP